MDVPEKVAYTARVTSTGGRAGHAVSHDGSLDVILADPRDDSPTGTTAEELFAAAYSACFNDAISHVASTVGIDCSGSTVTTTIQLGPHGESSAFSIIVEVAVPGQDVASIQDLANRAHQICPYSKAMRGNVQVEVVAIEG